MTPDELRDHIDWLFRQATAELEKALPLILERRRKAAEKQRAPFASLGLPTPGEDPQLEELIQLTLSPWLKDPLPVEALQETAVQARIHLSQENKRKNLVGEGFEDVLAAIVQRLPGSDDLEVHTRRLLSQIPGFSAPAMGEKERKVDMDIIRSGGQRVLISAKWSVRADREEQFEADFDSYERHEISGKPFDFILITNEFDAARLVAACRRRSGITPIFARVVHINPAGLLAAYGPDAKSSASELPEQIAAGRLIGFGEWLAALVAH